MNIAVTAREIIRHVLFITNVYSALNLLRRWRGQSMAHLHAEKISDRFDAIYNSGVWQHGDEQTPLSGHGSTVSGTRALRSRLPVLLNKLGGKTLIDIGCGDFSWMQHVRIDQAYVGIDVVASVIATNKKEYASPSRTFLVADAIEDPLPDGDIVICRELLFHLSFEHIRKLLGNVLSKPRSYLMLTTDRATSFNSNIPTGDYRLLNLEAWPFNFPPPIHEIDDASGYLQRTTAVWSAEQLRDKV
ncbi:class I SAM-dependent methyltransferase [Bradyrhizobium sp. RDT46]|uniref:class I SAM-dependent methyltransferase n=1 Tax=Bradyrhizobium sp. RDT46 TaxID=3341829 RepID=UPI0035C6A211